MQTHVGWISAQGRNDGSDMFSPVGAVLCSLSANKKARGEPRLFIFENTQRAHRSLLTTSNLESQGLTIMPLTSLRKAAVSTTSEKG